MIAFGLRNSRLPKATESSEDLRMLPAGAKVLVYRTVTKHWEGPLKFIDIYGERGTVQTNRGRCIFQYKSVKPWTKYELSSAGEVHNAHKTVKNSTQESVEETYKSHT